MARQVRERERERETINKNKINEKIVIRLYNYFVSYVLPNIHCMGDVPKQTSLWYDVGCSNIEKYHNSYMVKRNMELYEGQIKDKIPSKLHAKYYCN